MKDRQVQIDDTSGFIPIVSPVLHFIAMTGVVFLRSSFGIVYLRHKSVFLVFGYAQILFTVYAALEPGVFQRYRGEVIFGTAAALLYMLHLFIAVIRATRVTGEHDLYSGTSHLLRFTRNRSEAAELRMQLGFEPALIWIVAIGLRFFTNCGGLANWLFLVAAALGSKEAINHWYRLRRDKRGEDMRDDTKDAVDKNATVAAQSPPGKTARKEKVKRPRASNEDEAPPEP
jgi:hypothetical protein